MVEDEHIGPNISNDAAKEFRDGLCPVPGIRRQRYRRHINGIEGNNAHDVNLVPILCRDELRNYGGVDRSHTPFGLATPLLGNRTERKDTSSSTHPWRLDAHNSKVARN